MDINETIRLNDTKGIIKGLETGLRHWHQAAGYTDAEAVYSWGSAGDLPNILI